MATNAFGLGRLFYESSHQLQNFRHHGDQNGGNLEGCYSNRTSLSILYPSAISSTCIHTVHQHHPTFSTHPIYTQITELAGHVPIHSTPDGPCSSFFFFTGAVEPQFNGLLYINKVLGITNDIPADIWKRTSM